jgi:PIN domain-containing protein
MPDDVPFYVVLDANVWVAERLLLSSLGSAVLFSLTGAHALIGLPEVVESEVKSVLTAQAEEAVEGVRKNTHLLGQLSRQREMHHVPTSEAIQEGMEQRWAELGGILKRIPFSLEQAKAALIRVVEKILPSGANNEQFRDCCIWEAASGLSAEHPVHLVTNDSAFYEGPDRSRGLAEPLGEELARSGRELRIYSSIRDFLGKMDRAVILDEAAIAEAIVRAVAPRAREIAANNARGFELGSSFSTRISGFATPKPSVVAVSFQVSFELTRLEAQEDDEHKFDANLRVSGSCSYDPNLKELSEIEVKEWSVSVPKGVTGTSRITVAVISRIGGRKPVQLVTFRSQGALPKSS